jgi:hypothetical protein
MLRSSGISRCIKYRLYFIYTKMQTGTGTVFILPMSDVDDEFSPNEDGTSLLTHMTTWGLIGKRRVYTENKTKQKKNQHQKRVLAADSRSKNCDGPCCEFAYHSTRFKYSTTIHFGTCVALPLFSLIFSCYLATHTHTEVDSFSSLPLRLTYVVLFSYFGLFFFFIFLFSILFRARPRRARASRQRSLGTPNVQSSWADWLAGRLYKSIYRRDRS